MKPIIRKLKLIFFVITCIFLSNFSLAIDPVEIGKFYQKDIEVNLSIIENLKQNINEEKFKIKTDIRTKTKKKEKENVVIKNKNINTEKVKTDNFIEKKFARIKKIIEKTPNKIQIFFNSETANIKDEDVKKIKNFINNQTNKKNLNLRVI